MYIFPQLSCEVCEYDILVQGHLKWNRYFGESADNPARGDPSTCTSVMIRGINTQGKPYVLIVDPTIRVTPEDYYFDIFRRTGLRPEAITHCFSTHFHMDHVFGLRYFPKAVWLTGPENNLFSLYSEAASKGEKVPLEIEGEFLPGVSTVHLPGHTRTLQGIAFRYRGKKYLVAGDGVMTKNHFLKNTTEFQWDVNIAAETIRNIKESFDFVIPGHDGLIVV